MHYLHPLQLFKCFGVNKPFDMHSSKKAVKMDDKMTSIDVQKEYDENCNFKGACPKKHWYLSFFGVTFFSKDYGEIFGSQS